MFFCFKQDGFLLITGRIKGEHHVTLCSRCVLIWNKPSISISSLSPLPLHLPLQLELLITSGGENIPPVILEDNIKKEVPFLSNVMAIGDRRKFLTCIVTLKVSVIDLKGAGCFFSGPELRNIKQQTLLLLCVCVCVHVCVCVCVCVCVHVCACVCVCIILVCKYIITKRLCKFIS